MSADLKKRRFPFSEVRTIWMNGELVPFEKASVHVLSHGLHYGSGVFEGIRCYDTPPGPAIFRLSEHLDRLLASCKVYRMELPYTKDELTAAILETLRANELRASYIRPLVFRGFGSIRIDPQPCPVETVLAAWPTRGSFLTPDAQEKGIDVMVSSWQRPSLSSLPVNAKATGNYLNSQLITMEAHTNGYHEGIALNSEGYASEGAADNLFVVQGETLITPPTSAAILPGITRASILQLAADLGIEAETRNLPRGTLYTCDEMFLSGTSVEISPIRSIDRIPVGDGKPGPITRRLMAELMGIARGEIADRHGWLTPVDER